MYTHMCMYLSISLYIYIYIYIEREREIVIRIVTTMIVAAIVPRALARTSNWMDVGQNFTRTSNWSTSKKGS